MQARLRISRNFQKRPQSTKLKSAAALSSSTVPELCFHQDHFRFRPLLSPQTIPNPSLGSLQPRSSKPLSAYQKESSDKEPGQATPTVEKRSLVTSFARSSLPVLSLS